MSKRAKCIVCDIRPQKEGSQYCHICHDRIEALTGKKPDKPFRYIAYQGAVVGMFPTGEDTYRPRMVKIDLKRIPKRDLINLDQYCPGFNRDQIKKMKRAVRAVTA